MSSVNNNIKNSKNVLQLSNRLGSAKCAADLIPPSAVARTGEQAITIEGRSTDFFLATRIIHTIRFF